MLRQAKAAGDRLIVGPIRMRPWCGLTRPVQDQDARALVLSALDGVDLVVVFGENTPLTLIEGLRPDVLVKGADYRVDQVV